MPLINRIEVSNFMNSRREDPWRPDWTFQEFDLKGENTAINMPNGRGKSTIVHALLALLAHDKSLSELRLRHFAPASTRHFSHVRLETYVWTDDGSPADLIAQSGGDFGGCPMVFGLYGNSGESTSHKLYAYQGTLEDCAVGRKEGNRITLIGNAAFLDRLSAMPGRFPATQRDDSRGSWRDHVASIFDMPSIEQQLVYQKAKGAEGSSGYFDVNPPRGRPFSETVFYERLAPELLTDMMGHVEEFSGERGIEDTIHQKVQGIIKAKARTATTADDLEKTRQVLQELERVKGKVDVLGRARSDESSKLAEFSWHFAAVKLLVLDEPVPGMPGTPPADAPFLVRALVLQEDRWWLPDKALETLTGEKPSALNQRADRHQIASVAAKKSQLIGLTCKLQNKDERGPSSQLYSLAALQDLLAVTTVFAAPQTQQTAAQAVQQAFGWAEAHGDTNPARLERREVKASQARLEGKRKALADRRDTLQAEKLQLMGEQQRIGEQQAEFRSMSNSGLFSALELSAPAYTGQQVQSEILHAGGALTTHQRQVAENVAAFGEWQQFVSLHGEQTDPADLALRLTTLQKEAAQAVASHQEALTAAQRAAGVAKSEAGAKKQWLDSLSAQSTKVAELRPQVHAFVERFGSEDPRGLGRQVRQTLEKAERRHAVIAPERSAMAAALAALQAFSGRHGSDTGPQEWLASRNTERNLLAGDLAKARETLQDIQARRTDLDKAAVAPGPVAREVLKLAGDDALALHTAIDGMGLPLDRKERVLSLLSALLFAPVYASAARAAQAAGLLAAKGIHSPVFIAAELADFCRNADIAYDGLAASTWLVGVRTRPVDCLLDPALVEKEKQALEEQITQCKESLAALNQRFAELDPEGQEAITARKAQEAIEKNHVAEDLQLQQEAARLEENLPGLRDRACQEALESIAALISYRALLAGKPEEVLAQELANADEAASHARTQHELCDGTVERLNRSTHALHQTHTAASVNAAHIPKLKQIKAFIDAGSPDFMRTAAGEEQRLELVKVKAEQRGMFRFELAESFVNSGNTRAQQIEARLGVMAPELTEITDVLIPEQERQLQDIGSRLPALEASIAGIDNFIRALCKTYRELATVPCQPAGVPAERLAAHPLAKAAATVRRASASKDTASALLALNEPLEDIDAAGLKHALGNARQAVTGARHALVAEIDRIKQGANLALNEQMRIGLERAKEDTYELLRMMEATASNYHKSFAANEAASQHLNAEWEQIASWLENFTRRLPGNFEAMRSVFRPVRDRVSGEIVTAGFDIEAKIADMQDVRSILSGIVEKVERDEQNRELLEDDEKARASHDKSMRKQIRDQFYRNVIIEPKIRVGIPSISRKPLMLEKNMLSSGQGVAMTLLWIVKMADYVTEREVQRQSVSLAARKRMRSTRTQFVIIDGAFSHLSDKRLITDALNGVKKARGKFQLVITGHDANYKNDFKYFPSYIVAREIGGNLMYADSETRRLLEPEAIGSRLGEMHLASWHQLPAAGA